jgi:undecaprenyl-diphosphatase
MYSWLLKRPRHQLLFGIAFFILGLFVKLTYEYYDDRDDISQVDAWISQAIYLMRQDKFNGPMVDITALGSISVITIVTIISVITFLALRDKIAALQIVVAASGAGICSRLMKDLVARDRPPIENQLVIVSGYSYPSGHSLAAAAFYFSLTYLICRHIPTYRGRAALYGLCLVLVFLVGLSRVYLGVHYPTDTLSGIMFGTSWALLVASYFSYREIRQSL